MTAIAINRPKLLDGKYSVTGSYRLTCSSGAVTTIAARTATAGQLLNFRFPVASPAKAFIKYIGARFILTTAYGTAQETGCDLILAHAFTVNGTDGTAVDVGSTVANTGKLLTGFATSGITAGCVRVADTAAITAGTHTLDANPFATLSDWSGAIGATVPTTSSGSRSGYGTLYDYRASAHEAPIVLGADEGFVIRNLILMGATGVGRWDFCVEWDEGVEG
ncbi:MAG: hypothetical protein KBD62_35230 [Kofleriaceae bacterium]|nr:hypothetical protein [Kofleriaceae bacterium]